MNSPLRRSMLRALLAAATPWPLPVRGAGKLIRIGWTDWADAEAITYLAKVVIEQRLGYRVEMVKMGVAELFGAVAEARIDLMLMCWLPRTHQSLLTPVLERTVDLGTLYSGTRIGWVVPNHVPESSVSSIEDLSREDVLVRLGGRIQGIERDSGLMKSSRAALADYRLGKYTLIEGSDAAVAEALDKAVANKEWAVCTAWTPHYLFSKHSLRYLRDPKGTFGSSESVHAIGRAGITADHPQVSALMGQLKLTVSELEALMYITQMKVYKGDAAMGTSERTASVWVGSQRKRVDRWVQEASR